jgi:inner membrane protein
MRGGLLAAVAGGLLLHIGMDYLNVYGVHPFYPFDNRWLYGDLVFIVEPAFWVAFGVPLAILAGRRARWLWLGLLALVLGGFMLRDYVEWWSLAGLAAGGLLLAVVQACATGRSRRGLAAGWALLGVFLGSQLVAERAARALVMQQAGDGRLVDVALSAFPANPVFVRFTATHARHGAAGEGQADGLKLRRRQMRRSVACPEAVQVAGNDGETGDPEVADQIVDLVALGPCAAVVAAAHVGETARRPCLLRQPGGQVLGIGALLVRGLRTAPDLPGRG